MGLLEQQNLLIQLLIDREKRADFYTEKSFSEFQKNLKAEDLEFIKSIPANELDSFAESLITKRLHEVGKILFLTRKAMKQDFAAEFRKFAQSFQPQTIKKHLKDALNFADYLIKTTTDQKLKNLIIYEQAKIKFYNSEIKYLYRKFDYPIKNLLREIVKSDSLENVKKSILPSFAIWTRLRNKPRHYLY